MANIENVAACVLDSTGYISTMKLQKLVYYSQAVHLVSTGAPLFENRIEAWANGPVAPDLFRMHRHKYIIGAGELAQGDASNIGPDEASSIKRVLAVLGSWTGAQLSELTHTEAPWVDARAGLAPGARSNAEITQRAMFDFYGSAACENPLFSAMA